MDPNPKVRSVEAEEGQARGEDDLNVHVDIQAKASNDLDDA